ncbi:beta-galactosidase [Cellulomonas endometrii]|uniref:beta-galactosidase n=1 Tax=Cellulomonas endometrii TaxID=3036301 RepID=UPI0024AD1468|nr:beta-galactosidase [Cellulomonas endometrii]
MNTDVPVTDTTSTRRVRVSPPAEPRRGHLDLGEPEGTADRIEVTSRWIERAGKPWFPITGEIHYSRLPRDRWSEVLGHARAGGLNSVATYVMWQAHEPNPGEFRWDGNRDLRSFIQVAQRHGLDVIVRMGPWAHGEARYGGFPDWLVERGIATRTNDPEYLELARALYAQTVAQLQGLTHAEGGPVIGVQMDNELYDQPQHLATLRTIAEDLGLRVPIWTATGWGGAQVPETLLPLYSAYSDGFWEETTTDWPEFAAFHFRYSEVRDDLTVGKDLREALDGIVLDPDAVPLKDDDALPFATCELGGGMHVAYHRRPLVTAEDVASLALAKVGSGSIWQGYYMYSGGTQRVGAHGTEQESHATGYPNDVPTSTYDFYAPIGEHAQIRPHHHLLRRQHLWLDLDGAAIAAMGTTVGGGSEDPAELRWSVRSDAHRGYVFATTYQPAKRPLEPQPGVQLEIELADETVTVPSRPVDLPAGVSVAWPVRYPLSQDLVLRSATAQLLTRVTDDQGDIVVLAATDGVPVELVLEGEHAVDGPVDFVHEHGRTLVELTAAPGAETVVQVPGARLLVVDEATANRLYRLPVGGVDRLVLSDAPVYALEGGLVLHPDAESADVSLLPAPSALSSTGAEVGAPTTTDLWTTWTVRPPVAGAVNLARSITPESVAAPEPRHGGPLGRLSAPTDFSAAARVTVPVPADAVAGADRALLRITWTGDVGRALVGDTVVSDHFWYGRPWDVDLTPWRDEVVRDGLTLELFPWRKATGVWVDPSVRDVADGTAIASLDVVRVARVELAVE